jgi:succinate-semialdehyde dehydrogenase
MSACNIVVATGGPGMVKAAYSSGRPSFGVGQGNAQTILAPDYTDFERFAMMTVGNRTYDNGMPCTTDQTLHVPKNRVAEVVAAFEKNDAYLIADPAEIQKMRETCFKDGLLNAKIVGQPAEKIAEMAGIKIPAGTRVLLCIVDKWGRDELLAKEIMCPFCRILPYEKYEDAVERVRTNYLMEGAGHTGAI